VLALGNTPSVNLLVYFSDGLVEQRVSHRSSVKIDGEQDGADLLIVVGFREGGVSGFDTSVAKSASRKVFVSRTVLVSGFKEVMSPAQDFFYDGDEVFLLGCKVSEGVRDIAEVRGRKSGGAEKVRGRQLGSEEAIVDGG
jgi:hypothetical protein